MQIADEVLVRFDEFAAALESGDLEAFLGQFADRDRLVFAADGAFNDTLPAAVRATFASVESMECDWSNRRVTVLAADAAAITATFECEGRTVDGVDFEQAGAWTSVYQNRDGVWRIVQAHESHRPAEGSGR